MNKLKPFLLSTLIVFIFSCKNERVNSYAIKDFRKSIQPFLSKIVSEGIVTYHDSADNKSIRNDELMRLARAESPVLRATALQEMLDRTSFNPFDIVINHLDDTAIIASDNGEFGIRLERVSDFLIGRTRWQTIQARDKTIESVITRHNYLTSAYYILRNIEAQEKYYPYIKDMATRPRRLNYDDQELAFDEIEYALYGLAKFQKKEDVQVIKDVLMKHIWWLSDVSFRTMKEFPDPAYLDVLVAYHRERFYLFSGSRPHGFTGTNSDMAAPEDFINALVAQQNERSANLLDTMLSQLPKYTCMPDKENIINEVIEQIWKHPCPAYARIREKVRQKAENFSKRDIQMERIFIPGEKEMGPFRWYN
jgi:hypothetical protein